MALQASIQLEPCITTTSKALKITRVYLYNLLNIMKDFSNFFLYRYLPTRKYSNDECVTSPSKHNRILHGCSNQQRERSCRIEPAHDAPHFGLCPNSCICSFVILKKRECTLLHSSTHLPLFWRNF